MVEESLFIQGYLIRKYKSQNRLYFNKLYLEIDMEFEGDIDPEIGNAYTII